MTLFLAYALLVALASFNRETSAFLVLIYAAYHGLPKWRETVVLLAIWAAITGGLHVVIGIYPHMLGALGTLQYNLATLPQALISNMSLLPLALIVALNYRHARPVLKRLAWVGLAYIGAIVVGAAWGESLRLVLPIMPLIIPVVLGGKWYNSGYQVAR